MTKLFDRFKRPCVVRGRGNVKVRGSMYDLVIMIAACLMTMEERGVNVRAVRTALVGLELPDACYIAKAAAEARLP